jgi:DNA-binding NtrC family response regulator
VDVTTLKYPREEETTTRFRLSFLEGPERGRVVEIPVDQTRTLLGTSQTCGVVVTDRHVSRRHLALGPVLGRLTLFDLGSSNGTRVNGVRVVECALTGGEIVHVGATTIRVEAIGTAHFADAPETSFLRAIGESRSMRRVFATCKHVATSSLPLIIEGETGTGKELLAECIHEAGPRRGGPFIVFDPSVTPENLLPAVVFGAEAGAVANSAGERAGLFERAHGGTLLIDGPADLPLDFQRTLVRAIERGECQRVGSDVIRRFDVRVIAISQVDLDRAVDEGRLREDLFHRLSGTRIEAPPLRDRPEDIGPLTKHFWKTLGGFGDVPPSLLARYESHRWPGNVRELQNAIAQRLATGPDSSGDESAAPALRPSTTPHEDVSTVLALDLPLPHAKQRMIAIFEAAYVARLLAKHGGNVTRASAASGVAHRYFQLLNARHRKG